MNSTRGYSWIRHLIISIDIIPGTYIVYIHVRPCIIPKLLNIYRHSGIRFIWVHQHLTMQRIVHNLIVSMKRKTTDFLFIYLSFYKQYIYLYICLSIHLLICSFSFIFLDKNSNIYALKFSYNFVNIFWNVQNRVCKD